MTDLAILTAARERFGGARTQPTGGAGKVVREQAARWP